ncbi:uncharacterized protein LOC125187288 isoform X2 [Salvia hispanica]|uniref:uncharacterized protein LOC125187288 isoform X2 n=1 Tax=Salvia hispanica TaxID=49212 RepID=UPI0020096E2E|nr:uncharacterized protein LOC125187288 isoform X2 [Salvia hispanica]
MKLPVDLTSLDLSFDHRFARMSSLVLMSCSMSNFMTSLGSMESNEIVPNMAALGILVLTVAGNIVIHTIQMRSSGSVLYFVLPQQVTSSVIMLLFLVTLCCMSLMVPGAKRYIGLKYDEMQELVSNRQVEWGRFSSVEVENMVKGYWVMAQTSCPQFVLARSAVSSISGLMCLLTALVLVEARFGKNSLETLGARLVEDSLDTNNDVVFLASNYDWSVGWILNIQSVGVAIGSIAPLLRWFAASWFKISETERRSFRDELKVDKYWTWRLVEWRDRSLPFQVQNRVCRKLLRDAVDFRQYVILLEGEPQLPYKILNNICNEADRLIQVGEKRRPENLIQLLKKSLSFDGVGRFDSSEIPSLHSQEPPNCWSLPVVTLTAISVALLSIDDENASQLLVCISEGLPIVKLIEETLDITGEFESIRKAAVVVWDGVELYKKWDGTDLKSTRLRGATHKETLQKLSNIAEKTVRKFVTKTRDILMQNPLNWPARIIAANSMYRITQTILLGMGDGENQGGDELFESISITISDILAACLTNLVQVITLKCRRNNIKEREESVRRAAILLGESKKILEILQQRELPSLDAEKAAKIDEWRTSMVLDVEIPLASVFASSGNEIIV